MEKRKVFKISIIDKEISRTEFDRNTFYTSDSELSLVFKLIEKDYSYDHGEILLYNENDKSFVTRKITKQDNDFVYEIESDIIPHYGTWKAQLQLVNDGDVYTSKPFDFKIVNDLSNLAPQPTLTDINNWSTLKQSANELIDEMQDIIVDVEQAESERASKENLRQQSESERVSKENVRQNSELKRENKENTRQNSESKRENNEKQRRISEFERVDKENTRQQAESQRQSKFETNEQSRQTAFETAEQSRQTTFETAEQGRQTTFEKAEQERQSAEQYRVSAEEQRKIDHEGRSAEFEGKADKVVLKNLVENGDFTNGVQNIQLSQGSRIENQKLVYAHGTSGSTIRYFTKISNTDLYYFYIKYNTNETSNAYKLVNNQGELYPINSSSTFHSHRQTYQFSAVISIYGGQNATHDLVVDYYLALNLTATFGAGNEPTKKEMDELIKVTGYIGGEYALNNKEMLIWTLALIRSNKNAIIALGGA